MYICTGMCVYRHTGYESSLSWKLDNYRYTMALSQESVIDDKMYVIIV